MAPMIIEEIDDLPSDTSNSIIELTQLEATLRQLLLDVARWIEQNSAHEPIVLRYTGGWVRDKLLGVPSHDIDVAISNMTGYQYGLQMKAYLDIPGNAEKYGLEGVASTEKQSASAGTSDKSKLVGGLHKIEANPEKSKHLETVTTRIFGLDIDLVNLRKETYTDDSRNPQMEFGTAEEDALRRDATVNAMFYNLNTQAVEDFTGQGHIDMRNRILRTPLEPYQTFKDDPLRVLRLIRFASRLGWKIDENALTAMRHDDIKDALRRKISRERVGTELEKALRGPNPHEALRLVLDIGLYETIFSDPATADAEHHAPDLTNASYVIDMLDGIDGSLATIAIRDAEESFLAWQLAALVPYRDAPTPEPAVAGRKAPPPIAAQIAREGIKATTKTCELIAKAIVNLDDIRGLVDGYYHQTRRTQDCSTTQDLGARDYVGMKIRAWGPQWRTQVVFAWLCCIADQPEQTESYTRQYNLFLSHLRDLDVLEAYNLRPLIDGKQLAKAMSTTPGPWMKDALEVVIAWQLRNPKKTDIDEAVAEVQQHGELAFSLADHVLKLTVRPLFIKSRPSKITNEGRRKLATNPGNAIYADDDEIKPWKKPEHQYALSLLKWVASSVDEHSVTRLWPSIIPPILTLIDDWQAKYKQLGASLLHTVLLTTPITLLERTGLGPVFQEALEPCLAFLPPVTSEEDALLLLPTIYETLTTLANVQHSNLDRRCDALDVILRKGIIYGFSHTSNYPALVSMLFQHLAALIDKLGIASVKHLKYVLPMLSEAMSYALSASRPDMLRSAAQCMQTVIRNGWPRMVVHRGEVLKAVTLCWLNLLDASNNPSSPLPTSDQVSQLKRDLKKCIDLLRVAIGQQIDFSADMQTLVNADARLAELCS